MTNFFFLPDHQPPPIEGLIDINTDYSLSDYIYLCKKYGNIIKNSYLTHNISGAPVCINPCYKKNKSSENLGISNNYNSISKEYFRYPGYLSRDLTIMFQSMSSEMDHIPKMLKYYPGEARLDMNEKLLSLYMFPFKTCSSKSDVIWFNPINENFCSEEFNNLRFFKDRLLSFNFHGITMQNFYLEEEQCSDLLLRESLSRAEQICDFIVINRSNKIQYDVLINHTKLIFKSSEQTKLNKLLNLYDKKEEPLIEKTRSNQGYCNIS